MKMKLNAPSIMEALIIIVLLLIIASLGSQKNIEKIKSDVPVLRIEEVLVNRTDSNMTHCLVTIVNKGETFNVEFPARVKYEVRDLNNTEGPSWEKKIEFQPSYLSRDLIGNFLPQGKRILDIYLNESLLHPVIYLTYYNESYREKDDFWPPDRVLDERAIQVP